MLPKNPSNKLETHEVFNVPSYLGDQDLWETDRALKDWTNILGGGWAVENDFRPITVYFQSGAK